jgi:hypothetical protein
MNEGRPHRFNMMLNDDEADMMRALVAARGLTASDLFRSQLRDAFAKYAKENEMTPTDCLATVRKRMPPMKYRAVERLSESPVTGRTPVPARRTRTP